MIISSVENRQEFAKGCRGDSQQMVRSGHLDAPDLCIALDEIILANPKRTLSKRG
ncbi:hypothetical protein [Pseudomonas sp. H3_G03]